jgi:hypothetical protein
LERAVSTIGAEKRAPPGMGSNPMSADITGPTVRMSVEIEEKLFTNRFMCPLLSIILLMVIIRATIRSRLMVCRLVMLFMELVTRREGPTPIHRPRIRDPVNRAIDRCTLSRLRVRIRPKIINIFISAGILNTSDPLPSKGEVFMN